MHLDRETNVMEWVQWDNETGRQQLLPVCTIHGVYGLSFIFIPTNNVIEILTVLYKWIFSLLEQKAVLSWRSMRAQGNNK